MNQTAAIELRLTTPRTDQRIEQQLVQRACRGDSDAFGELYEATLNRIYRYIYFRVSDDATAEDLTSKVYLKAWESLPRYKTGNSPFLAWLYTIAHNAVIDHYRVTRQHIQLDEISNLADHEDLPHEQCENRAEAEKLRRALQLLTPEQREVVTMKLLDGLTTEQIAARIHKTPGAIRALQMRGLQALARICRAGED